MDLNKILESLHGALAQDLLEKVQSGEATAADLSVARQFLKDNGIDSLAFADAPITNLAAVLRSKPPMSLWLRLSSNAQKRPFPHPGHQGGQRLQDDPQGPEEPPLSHREHQSPPALDEAQAWQAI